MARISQRGRTWLSGSYGDFAGFWIGSYNGLVGGPRVTPPPCLRLLEPVALAVQLQNMDMKLSLTTGKDARALRARGLGNQQIKRDAPCEAPLLSSTAGKALRKLRRYGAPASILDSYATLFR
jgi:hypothetical protein